MTLLDRDAANASHPLLDRCSRGLARNQLRIASAFFVPGRIEVLGKHTDYGGGRSLLCALERGICMVAVPRSDDVVEITDARTGDHVAFRMTPELEIAPGWAVYPTTVAQRIARDFSGPLRGADISLLSNLPPAAGMSSSSALVVACFLALADVNQLNERDEYRRNITNDEALADYLSAVEAGRPFAAFGSGAGVGTQSGSEDHTAILCARDGELVQYSFAPVCFEQAVPLPESLVFVLASSGVVAEKAGAARQLYNNAAEQLRLAAHLWRQASGRGDATLGAALRTAGGTPTSVLAAVRAGAGADSQLVARVEQFIEECEQIIPTAVRALAADDRTTLGRVVDRSHELADTVLRNQIGETNYLKDSARELGAVAASAFGAGFGGGVWALIDAAQISDFPDHWKAAYHQRFPQHTARSAFFLSQAAPAAIRLGLRGESIA